jgi:hypothetical protein
VMRGWARAAVRRGLGGGEAAQGQFGQ